METKYIFITGGVVSSLGKGIIGSSIGQLLKKQGLKVTMQKFDPYINVEPGLLTPLQHGEVFVTDDGTETDLDLGHYERFLDENLNKASAVTSGQIYLDVIEKERKGFYKGQTVQVIPHITNQIKAKLVEVAKTTKADVVITEIGGTVGDIESLPFLEAIRQARNDFGYHNTIYIHTTLVPYIKAAKEIKTKPTQHSVKQLMNLGIYPDMLALRSEKKLNKDLKEKISTFTGIDSSQIFNSPDIKVIYEMILNLKKQQVEKKILNHFKIDYKENVDLSDWEEFINKIKSTKDKLNIMIVGKYVNHKDAYLSVNEALKHAGFHYGYNINFINVTPNNMACENFETALTEVDGIVIPGGYGKNGFEHKLNIVKMARERRIPLLGICLGMQLVSIEIVRNLGGLKEATSREFDSNTKESVIEEVKNPKTKNYIVGLHNVRLEDNSLISKIYNSNYAQERFRHHYELNKKYIPIIENAGYNISGFNLDTDSPSVIEDRNHPFFIAVQFHPEYLSRPLKAHPLFLQFLKSIIELKK